MTYQVKEILEPSLASSSADNKSSTNDYDLLLNKYGFEKKHVSFYWQIGSITKTQGWILHLSVIQQQLFELLERVIPFLMDEKLSFKIPKNIHTAHLLAAGSLGYINLGKIVCIYPESDNQALRLATELIQLTSPFNGPEIPTDLHLGSIVYTRYGSFSPILRSNSQSQPVKYIYDGKGSLVPDPYRIPFKMPTEIVWPFESIVDPHTATKKAKLLHFTYFPVYTIKSDAKGNVIKALYFEKFWKISPCVIKEGRQNMFSDDYKRDIRDRLQWQYDLHKDLQDSIPIPRPLGFFYQNETAYFAIQYLKGVPLSKWIRDIYNGQIWRDLQMPAKINILEKIIDVLNVIQKLHEKGYIHRDITSENILISKKGYVTLIDLELTWSLSAKYPSPPFSLGTPGFMSPEQQNMELPTIEQDIYAIGALLVNLFTGFYPARISQMSLRKMVDFLTLLIGNTQLVCVISNCLEDSPAARPSLSSIKITIEKYSTELANRIQAISPPPTPENDFYKELQKSLVSTIAGIGHPDFLNSDGCWYSESQRQEMNILNRQYDVTLSVGWHTGMAGAIWLLAKAKQLGFEVETSSIPLANSLLYIKSYLDSPPEDRNPTLYTGDAGIALALSEGMKSGMILTSDENKSYLTKCFFSTAPLGGLRYGIAGQGIAILSSAQWLSDDFVKSKLDTYIETLMKSQLANGAWPTYDMGKKNDIVTGLSGGVAGLLWFLLAYLSHTGDLKVEMTIRNGINWLTTQMTLKDGVPYWPVSSKSKLSEPLITTRGIPGIILTYIKAYKILGNPEYKNVAYKWIGSINPRLLIEDFSLNSGLSGLGEIYLDAAQAFEDPIWNERALWITQIFLRTAQKRGEGVFWTTSDVSTITMDLFPGNGGIIHFLLRVMDRRSLSHPFWPTKAFLQTSYCAQSGATENL